jgi:Mrp family chromosome partitioning ATPase/capsular polysaccharide biosynthesis protein
MEMRPERPRSPHLAPVENQRIPARGSFSANGAGPYDIRRALIQIRRRLGIIIASLVIGTLLSLAVTVLHKPNYTATALLAANGSGDDGTGRPDDSSIDTQIAMLQSSVFVEHAFEVLSRDERLKSLVPNSVDLERRLKVNQVMRSRLIALNFTAKSPTDAADIANTIARLYVEDPLLQGAQSLDDASGTLSQQIAVLEAELRRVESDEVKQSPGAALAVKPSDLRDQIAALKLSQTLARRRQESSQQWLALSPPIELVALAKPPERPTSLSSKFIIIPAVLFSVIFGVALALAIGALDRRIYLPSDLKDSFPFPYAGGVPSRPRRVFSKTGAPSSGVGYLRAIDAVVTETLLLQKVQRRVILVTTSEGDDSAFEFASSVASAAARMRQRVLLVDLDTTPARHRLFGWRKSSPGPNVFDVLAGGCPASVAIQSVPATDLDYLPGGSDSGVDLLALIACGRLKQLLTQLRTGYDWIILKGPPVIGVSATRLIAAAVDATILVVRSKSSRFPAVRDALDLLASSVPLDAFADISPQIVTVLTDAPGSSIPAAFRDRKAPKHADGQFNPALSAGRSPPEAGPEESAALEPDNANCLVPSHGLFR